MSPFAHALRSLRHARGLRQVELADLVGYQRTYLSALENDLRHSSSDDLVQRLGQALDLTAAEMDELLMAQAKSKRTHVIPGDASRQAYELVYELFERLDSLSEVQIQVVRGVLQLSGNARSSGRDRQIRPCEGVKARKERAM